MVVGGDRSNVGIIVVARIWRLLAGRGIRGRCLFYGDRSVADTESAGVGNGVLSRPNMANACS